MSLNWAVGRRQACGERCKIHMLFSLMLYFLHRTCIHDLSKQCLLYMVSNDCGGNHGSFKRGSNGNEFKEYIHIHATTSLPPNSASMQYV